MTREHIKKLLPVLQAFADGEDLYYSEINSNKNWAKTDNPTININLFNYKIKRPPIHGWVLLTKSSEFLSNKIYLTREEAENHLRLSGIADEVDAVRFTIENDLVFICEDP